MKYNIGINNYLKEHYKDLCENAENVSDFFNHISSCSKCLQEILSTNIPDFVNPDIFYADLKLLQINNLSISIVVLCKNEQRCIRRCLSSIYNEVSIDDEVIVIDTGSTDASLSIIAEFPETKLYRVKWNDNFAQVRNVGLLKANNNWVFFIDADEEITQHSICNLKMYINIIEWLKIDQVAIAPTIINHNMTMAQGVRRVIRKSDNIKFYGTVHEELRKNPLLLGKDVIYISFDNIILHHDGYKDVVVKHKKKSEKYLKGLKYMIAIEPLHPRWLFFVCRDNKSIFSENEYEKQLLKIIELCEDVESFEFYKVRTLSNLISFYLDHQRLEDALHYLAQLKEMVPQLSDVLYFETLISYIKAKQLFAQMLNKLIFYRQSHDIDYGSLHSRLYHIDYLIALLFFEIGEYKHSFDTYSKLGKRNGRDYLSNYEPLYTLLQLYLKK